MKTLVSQEERAYIAKNLSARIEGADTMSRIVDINALAKRIQDARKANKESMIINIDTIYLKKGKEANKSITFVKDAEYDCLYGIFAGIDGYKNIKWSRVQMVDTIQLNLEHLEDCKRWAVIRMHSSVEGSPLENDPTYKIHDPSIEAQKTERRVTIVQKLFDVVDRMDGLEIAETMRYLGLNLAPSTGFKVARATLLDTILRNAEGTYDLLSLKTRSMEAKIKTAIELSIVQEHPEKGIMYNQVPLGININDAIDKLSKDKPLMMSIFSLVEQKDTAAHNLQDDYLSLTDKKKENKKSSDEGDNIKM